MRPSEGKISTPLIVGEPANGVRAATSGVRSSRVMTVTSVSPKTLSASRVRACAASQLRHHQCARPRWSFPHIPLVSGLERVRGYATSHEVIPTVQSVAVPLALRGQRPAAIAVVHVATELDEAAIAARLLRSAR